MSASKITGKSVEEYEAYNLQYGEHHPDRQKIGKVDELGLGFGGWLGAWRQFDDSDTFTDREVKNHILAWRGASPAIVEMWGGQWRGEPCFEKIIPMHAVYSKNGKPFLGYAELYGVEGMAIYAIQNPGVVFDFRGIKFQVRTVDVVTETDLGYKANRTDALVITLLSGRELTYHEPRLTPSTREWACPGEVSITYSTWNSNPKYGMMGWVRMSTFGGRLTENIVQATAHDIQRYSIRLLMMNGYPVVLHVYDENVAEIPIGFGSIAQFEKIMQIMPPWAKGWPVRAAGGWRGHRYRKG